MKYTIVPAARQHLPYLPSIETAAGKLFPREDLPGPLQFMAITAEEFAEAFEQHLLWVVNDEFDLPVAFLIARIVDTQFHILEFDVHPSHGKKGIGAIFLKYVLTEAKQRGFSLATLTTFAHLSWNAPFYAKRGFVVIQEEEMGTEMKAIVARETVMGLKRRVAMRADLQRMALAPIGSTPFSFDV